MPQTEDRCSLVGRRRILNAVGIVRRYHLFVRTASNQRFHAASAWSFRRGRAGPVHSMPPTLFQHRDESGAPSDWIAPVGDLSLVSIIIPTRNRRKQTSEAIASCHRQTYRPIEVIVVDDGSTDDTPAGTEDAARRYRDPHFHVQHLRQAHEGAPAARNRGLRASRGEFIQFLDSDDLLLPDKLTCQIEHLSASGMPFNYCQVADVTPAGETISVFGVPMPPPGEGGHITGYHFHTAGPVLRRQVCAAIGRWDETQSCHQDYYYFACLKARGYRGALVQRILAHRRRHNGATIAQQAQRDGSLDYALGVEQATLKVIALLHRHGGWTRAERRHLARQMLFDAAMFAQVADRKGVVRCLHRASAVSPGRHKLRFYRILFRVWWRGIGDVMRYHPSCRQAVGAKARRRE